MSTWVNVARYHLVRPVPVLAAPWAILAFSFAVNLVIFRFTPVSHHLAVTGHGLVPVADTSGRDTGGVASVFVMFFILGLVTISRSLPFGLALGVSRRSYYAGTALLGAAFAAVGGLVLTVAQAIERATGGWGVSMHFFQVSYVLDGPWYLTWLTSFVVLALTFVYGMWFGIVYRRWNLIGSVAFVAAQVTVLLVAALVVTGAHAWPGVGHFFTGLTAAGLTGVLAALAAVLFTGGRATIRRATV
jgi:hypothetical protein